MSNYDDTLNNFYTFDFPEWELELPEIEDMPPLNINMPPLEDWDFPDLSGLNFQLDLDWDQAEAADRIEPEPEPERIKSRFPLRILPGKVSQGKFT
jgi:hypothetical protein